MQATFPPSNRVHRLPAESESGSVRAGEGLADQQAQAETKTPVLGFRPACTSPLPGDPCPGPDSPGALNHRTTLPAPIGPPCTFK